MLSTAVNVVLMYVFVLVLAWSTYNLPILAVGIRNLWQSEKNGCKSQKEKQTFTFSIIVPAKNEEKVIGRLLNALSRLNYPKDKIEIIVVEDGSTDETLKTCMKYTKEKSINVKVVRKPISNGKPSALNYGVNHATGEIIGIFDADSIPDPDILNNVCKYFEELDVAAVQGRTMSINSDENMLTKFISYEEVVWCETYLRGKDVLDLFVHLKGSCQFVRRNVLEILKGFDENVLSEDMELSARLVEKGYRIRYASDVCAWQESSSNLKQLFRQRTRWFRGTMEVAFKYGRLMTRLSKRNLDAEATLFGPFILIASAITYLIGGVTFFLAFDFDVLLTITAQLLTMCSAATMFLCGLALAYITKPRKLTNLLWLPFVYFYWSLQAFVAFYASFLIVFRRPKDWTKTEKTGRIHTKSLKEPLI